MLVESFEEGELVSKYTLQRALNMGGAPLERHVAHFVVSRGEDLYLKMLLSEFAISSLKASHMQI